MDLGIPIFLGMTVPTENDAPSKSTKITNLNSLGGKHCSTHPGEPHKLFPACVGTYHDGARQLRRLARSQPKSQSEFVPRDTKKSEVLDVVDFIGAWRAANQNLSLNLYHEILRNRRFLMLWISGLQHFQWQL